MAPSQEDHAESLGVSRPTIARWEADRKEIKSDPELAPKAVTPEGYQEAKAEVRKRRNVVVPDYRVDDAMGPSREYRRQVTLRSLPLALEA
jgi:transcriptional regulator with XRE-family HTH domain